MLDTIIHNFGLIKSPQWKDVVDEKKNKDDDLDTFKELTATIDEIIAALPTIVVPSTIVGKSRWEGFKEIARLYKSRNLSKVFLLSCTMVNLLARHSGAKEVSKIAGFMQNCLALYSIGDNLCSHISFNWDYCDTMYVIVNNEFPNGMGITMARYRELVEKYDKQNHDTFTLTNSSSFVLVNLMKAKEKQSWFSSVDQKEHEIVPVKTNVRDVLRRWTRDEDDGTDVYSLNYEFDDDAVANGTVKNAVFILKFDEYTLYIVQNVNSSSDTDNNDRTVYEPSRDIRFCWLPENEIDLSRNEINAINENISQYLSMLFVNNIDTERFMFSFDDDGELLELVRPKAIPKDYVSDEIPKMISAIQTLHDKRLSRCYAMVGQAGTGKTIGAQQISNAFLDVCTFKITQSVVEDENTLDSMMKYVKAVKRCIIILDDMDRNNLTEKNNSVVAYLTFFDKLNQSSKNDGVSYVFIATINDPSRINKLIMCRSGRIDQMIEIGYPDINALRYLFNYNDKIVNPDNLTDFNDPAFDKEFQYAIESKITAADISNIFADMVIYGTKDEKFTPENVHLAIDHIKGRNDMASNNYMN